MTSALSNVFMSRAFPNLFGDHFLDSVFDELGDKNTRDLWPKTNYPYNLYVRKDGTTVIEFALAGFDKSEVKVEVVDDQLVVSAAKDKTKKVDEDSDEKDSYYISQIAKRDMKCSFSIAQKCDVENINCSFENGLLTITIPKKKEAHKLLSIA